MTQNHQSMLKCVNLVKASIALLGEVTPAKNEGDLRTTLEQLKNEIQIVIDRAERKHLRRVIREKINGQTTHEGGD